MITPVQVPGGRHHYEYEGPCGVSGAPAQQTIDLTVIPENVRESVRFREQLYAFFAAVGPGVDNVDNPVVLPSTGLPETLQVDVYSSDAGATLKMQLVIPHTATR